MGERNQESLSGSMDDIFDPAMGEITDEDFDHLIPLSTEKQRLSDKRRRAEQRLEERRMRDEIGYYDMDFDDF